jgi:photosystem II stability/assembly factor-like uncharacterized protein
LAFDGQTIGQFEPVGPDVAWATTSGSGSAPTQQILRSIDGGVRWQDVTPPGMARAAGDHWITGTDFLDSNHAWVVSSGIADGGPQTLVWTSDGGQRWSRIGRLPSFDCNVQFVNLSDGWCVTVGAALGSDQVIVYRTTDGAHRWTLVSKGKSATGSPGWPGSLPLACSKRVTFLAPMQGWAGYMCNGGRSISPLYETTAGGHLWVDRNVQPLPPGYANEDSPPADWVALPVLVGALGAAGVAAQRGLANASLVYRTTDGGSSWYPVAPPGAPRAWGIDLVSATDWKLISGSTILSTNDAGRRWQTTHSDVRLTSYGGSEFVSSAVGWYLDGDQVLRTTDGGESWRKVTIPGVGG